MTLDDMTIEIQENGHVTFPGHDFEAKGAMLLHHRTNGILVVKHPGGKGWSGVGQKRQPIHAHFMVLRQLTDPKGFKPGNAKLERFKVEKVVEFPLRQGEIYPAPQPETLSFAGHAHARGPFKVEPKGRGWKIVNRLGQVERTGFRQFGKAKELCDVMNFQGPLTV